MFSPEEFLNPKILLAARDREEAELKKQTEPLWRRIDQVTTLTRGSFLGRTLDNYKEILSHNGAVDFFTVSKKMSTSAVIVDSGCGGGVALAELRNLLPQARLVGIDTRYTPSNTIVDAQRNPIETVARLFEREGVEFYQNIFLNLGQILPTGYDVLISVGAFYDEYEPTKSHAGALKLFYDNLHEEGIVQILYNPLQKNLGTSPKFSRFCTNPFYFYTRQSGNSQKTCISSQSRYYWYFNVRS